MNSYCRTLIESQSRPFKIRHQRVTIPSVEITMTLFTVCKKPHYLIISATTCQSINQSKIRSYCGTLSRGRPLKIRHIILLAAPSSKMMMTSFPVCQKTHSLQKCSANTIEQYYGVRVCPFRIRHRKMYTDTEYNSGEIKSR